MQELRNKKLNNFIILLWNHETHEILKISLKNFENHAKNKYFMIFSVLKNGGKGIEQFAQVLFYNLKPKQPDISNFT